jgi:hypothetical protein
MENNRELLKSQMTLINIFGGILILCIFLLVCLPTPKSNNKDFKVKGDTISKIDSVNNMKYTIILTPKKHK